MFDHLYKKSMRRAIIVQIRMLSIKLSDVVKFIGFSQNIPVFRRVRVLKVGRMPGSRLVIVITLVASSSCG